MDFTFVTDLTFERLVSGRTVIRHKQTVVDAPNYARAYTDAIAAIRRSYRDVQGIVVLHYYQTGQEFAPEVEDFESSSSSD